MSNFIYLFIFPAEPEQDFVTCGDCQREFNLCDIVKFIQHKVNRCNKENVEPHENSDSFERDGGEESRSSSHISNRRTSISAPIANRSTPELRDKASPRPSHTQPSTPDLDGAAGAKRVLDNDEEDIENDNEEEEEERRHSRSARRKLNCVDAGSNTVNQGI